MIVILSSKHLYMGNKLFQFSNFISFSLEHQIPIANISFIPYSSYFEKPSTDLFCRFPYKKSKIHLNNKWAIYFYNFLYSLVYHTKKLLKNRIIRVIDIGWDKVCNIQDPEFIEIAKKTKILIVMGWQFGSSPINKYHTDITSYFRPIEKHQIRIDSYIEKIEKETPLIIGVHIRQGDFKTFENGRYYYETSDYIHFIKQCDQIFKGEKKFLICSNEKQDFSSIPQINIIEGPGHPIEDMYSLARCNYIIAPPSTFSMWASFYGDTPLCMLRTSNQLINLNDFKVFPEEI